MVKSSPLVHFVLLCQLFGLFVHTAWSHETPCSHGNRTLCLAEVRQFLHSRDWWFGDSFTNDCPEVQPGSDVIYFKCHNPSSFKTIASRLLQKDDFDANVIQQVLRIRFSAPQGSYTACGHRWSVPAVSMTTDVDHLHTLYYDSWSLGQRPAVVWEPDEGRVYTLVVYDVGNMNLCGLWVNIRGGDSALGEEVVPYFGLTNPIYRRSFLVFALFVQNETIAESDLLELKDNFWSSVKQSSSTYLLTRAISLLGHRVQDPMAVGIVSMTTDPYSIQRYKHRSIMNNCPFLTGRMPRLIQIMDSFNLTARYKTSYDHRGPYFEELEVEVKVVFWSDAINYTACCNHIMEQETEIPVHPLGWSVIPPLHLRYKPFVQLNPVNSKDSVFFLDKLFTLILLDVTDMTKNTSDPMTSLLWFVTDSEGPLLGSKGRVNQNYVMPTPPLHEERIFMLFVFRQDGELGDFRFRDFCKNNDTDNCSLDLHTFVVTYGLHFSGVVWFKSKADLYLRSKLYENDPSQKAHVCQGIRGYTDPCPATDHCPSATPTTSPVTLTPLPQTPRPTTPGRNKATSISINTFLLLIVLAFYVLVAEFYR